MQGKLVVATRSSPLAVAQTQEALDLIRPHLTDTAIELLQLTSPGDRDLQTPLTDATIADDFFTRDLDQALLNGTADLAIHSAKDLPVTLHPDLVCIAMLPARDIRDAWVFRADWPADRPPRTIGTSSPGRLARVREIFPDAEPRPIRGAIGERLAQLDAGHYDAVIIAACALERLHQADRISGYVPGDPAPQQGRLAIVIRRDATELAAALRPLDVRIMAGCVALIACDPSKGGLPDDAERLIEQADVLMRDPALSDRFPRANLRGRIIDTADRPASDLHRLLLHEAEKGQLVACLMSATASDAIASAHQFLHDWNLRVEPIGFTPTTSMSSPRTLFVGTDPTRFLRFGPLTHCPLIQQAARPVAERVRQIQQAQAEGIDGILFPSRFAVDTTLEALTAKGQALADLANLRILAVGPATAARLQEHGLTPTRSVADYGGIEALASLSDNTIAGTYLYPCSDLAPQAQRIARLAHCGIKLVPAVVYETQRITGAQLPDTPFDRVLFTSPSTVAAYFDTFPSEQQQPRIWLAIGPATANALRERGGDAIRLSVI